MSSVFLPVPGRSQALVPATDANGGLQDAKESTSISFEWTLRGLKNIFESSKGEAKSKVTKSPRFGDGRWQIMFYANSGIVGTDGQTFVSVYLGCEPTIAEKESGVNGKWSREGLFNFSFEILRIAQFNKKEAHNHSFYYPGAQNWGWAQFARRDLIQQHNAIRQHDAMVIVCSITSSPVPPAPIPPISRHVVPKDILDTVGSLLDDPAYSDIEFFLPRRRRGEARQIYASRKLLRRVEYFDDMFKSGFAEGASHPGGGLDIEGQSEQNAQDDASVSDITAYAHQFDDSDFEDEEESVLDNDHDVTSESIQQQPEVEQISEATVTEGHGGRTREESPGKRRAGDEDFSSEDYQDKIDEAGDTMPSPTRNIRPKLSHPSSPRSRDVAFGQPDIHAIHIYRHDRIRTPVIDLSHHAIDISDPVRNIYRFYSFGRPLGNPVAIRVFWGRCPSESATTVGDRRVFVIQSTRSEDEEGMDLKDRAFKHIVKSLTVENVAYEAFSAFAAAFEDVRKVEIAFMFDHWLEVRKGALMNIGQQLRLGKLPGFEEVWPMILQNLVADDKKGDQDAARN
ncbi:hypothetical protein BN946_scf184801.g42 [Trametes cinnabarina]|uniref:MATH domain-containing protein n=1 Tax=Pycnoporus cinnabarinus TaxID=5643 RepID=A0A060SF40_PYCCI|nr:hypothetical protein BN946_scf184801.g42 [Trametes cinnabarina]